MKVTAFVPARCGSKAIRLKNIRPFFGQPLIFWCLQALEECTAVDQVVLATDCQEITDCAQAFGFSKLEIYRREPANAQDQSATEDVMREYIEHASLPDDHYFLLVQATSPFTGSQDFEKAIDMLKQGTCDSLLSCSRVKRFLWSDQGQPLNYDFRNRPRRQDFSGTLMENGAFYLNQVKNIKEHGNRLSGNIGIYEMEPYTALELDEETDWAQGEDLMQKYHNLNPRAHQVKLFLSDVDGVLTDAGMYYTENGDELKKFNTYDGMGFILLQKQGVKVGILTKEDRELNRRRALKLKLDYDFHGVEDKLPLVEKLCKELDLTLQQVAYIGDDINDLELLKAVGVAACPSSARKEVKKIPGIYQLKTAGGNGAVREFVEQILLK